MTFHFVLASALLADLAAEQWERIIGPINIALALGAIGISSTVAILLGLSMHRADRAYADRDGLSVKPPHSTSTPTPTQDHQPSTRAARRQAQQQQVKANKQKGRN